LDGPGPAPSVASATANPEEIDLDAMDDQPAQPPQTTPAPVSNAEEIDLGDM